MSLENGMYRRTDGQTDGEKKWRKEKQLKQYKGIKNYAKWEKTQQDVENK